MSLENDFLIRAQDPPGDILFQPGIKPQLFRVPEYRALAVFYKQQYTAGQILVEDVPSDPRLAIVESTLNHQNRTGILSAPSPEFISSLWNENSFVVENRLDQTIIGRRYRTLLEALLQLDSFDEKHFLAEVGFKLNPAQYFSITSAMERLILSSE